MKKVLIVADVQKDFVDGAINGIKPQSEEVMKRISEMHAATEHKRQPPHCFKK